MALTGIFDYYESPSLSIGKTVSNRFFGPDEHDTGMLMSRLLLALVLSTVATPATSELATDSLEIGFVLEAPAEAIAEITASAPGAAWNRPGAEAAVATIYLDGRYNQDVVLFQGTETWTYRVFLGPLEAGSHRLCVERNARWSAQGAGLELAAVHVRGLASNEPEQRAIAHAPILYARADTLGHFSDIPLLMWYERFSEAKDTVLQYTVIFSNEDAGTTTDALMARWGRATDIEYVYRVRLDAQGKIREEAFQGPEHKDFAFSGRKEGRHPFLLVLSQNNIFADTGFSALQYRLLPVRADLNQHSREEVMDRFHWTYRLMAQELEREGKLRPYDAVAGTAVGDPRQYLYLEINAESRDSGVVAWVKLKGQPRWYSSHRGQRDLAVSRSGWFRTAVELPTGTAAEALEFIAIECVEVQDPRNAPSDTSPETLLREISKVFLLDADYRPGPNLLSATPSLTLRPGEMHTFIPQPR